MSALSSKSVTALDARVEVCFTNQSAANQAIHAGIINNDQIKSIESLDLAVAKQPRAGQRDEAPQLIEETKSESPGKYTTRIAQRAGQIVPATQNLIESGLAQISVPASSVTSGGIPVVADPYTLSDVLSPECLIFPIAAGSTLDSALFMHPKHSDLSRAVVLLHQSLAIQANANTANCRPEQIRELVSRLITQTPGTQVKVLKNLTQALLPAGSAECMDTASLRVIELGLHSLQIFSELVEADNKAAAAAQRELDTALRRHQLKCDTSVSLSACIEKLELALSTEESRDEDDYKTIGIVKDFAIDKRLRLHFALTDAMIKYESESGPSTSPWANAIIRDHSMEVYGFIGLLEGFEYGPVCLGHPIDTPPCFSYKRDASEQEQQNLVEALYKLENNPVDWALDVGFGDETLDLK